MGSSGGLRVPGVRGGDGGLDAAVTTVRARGWEFEWDWVELEFLSRRLCDCDWEACRGEDDDATLAVPLARGRFRVFPLPLFRTVEGVGVVCVCLRTLDGTSLDDEDVELMVCDCMGGTWRTLSKPVRTSWRPTSNHF